MGFSQKWIMLLLMEHVNYNLSLFNEFSVIYWIFSYWMNFVINNRSNYEQNMLKKVNYNLSLFPSKQLIAKCSVLCRTSSLKKIWSFHFSPYLYFLYTNDYCWPFPQSFWLVYIRTLACKIERPVVSSWWIHKIKINLRTRYTKLHLNWKQDFHNILTKPLLKC
jgi:hypothetical protein